MGDSLIGHAALEEARGPKDPSDEYTRSVRNERLISGQPVFVGWIGGEENQYRGDRQRLGPFKKGANVIITSGRGRGVWGGRSSSGKRERGKEPHSF